jgi:hypothetical protein
MFILPYTHKYTNHNNIQINNIKFLTVGGKSLWEENNSLNIDKDILNPNDIYRKIPGKIIKYDKNLYLYEIDLNKTNINDFYKWEEIDIENNNIFCWKTYYYIMDNNKLSWLNIPETEIISNYYIKDIIKKIL